LRGFASEAKFYIAQAQASGIYRAPAAVKRNLSL